MKSRWGKLVILSLLAVTITMAPAGVSMATPMRLTPSTAPAAQGDAVIQNKDEVVYAVLSPEGAVNTVQVVNRFEITAAGSYTDRGNYTSVTNLTDTRPLTRQGDSVAFDATEGNFYYQGNMASADLPWTFDISYTLDGTKTTPQELAGKSGKLEIRIRTAKNSSANAVFYENYMLQLSMSLDTDKCGDILAPGATVAIAGKNTVIAHTILPGKDADISVSAAVRDFAMDGISISAMPFSMNIDLPDTGGMENDLKKLAEGIAGLNDGVGKLADGAAELKEGSSGLKDGSAGIQQGLQKLSGSSGQLIKASAQIKSALSQIASNLKKQLSGGMDLSDLAKLPQGLKQMSQGLKDISTGLADLKNGFVPAYSALDSAIQGIPDTEISQEQITALYGQTDLSQHALLDVLVANYAAGQTVKGTYGQVKEAFEAIGPTIDLMSGSLLTTAGALDEMANGIGQSHSKLDALSQLTGLVSGLAELSSKYSSFHGGLTDYMNGLNELSAGYAEFHSGVSDFDGGLGEFNQGMTDLREGIGTLRDETADMPEQMQNQIDSLLDEYTGTDFTPVSFTSPENKNIGLVQFVLKTDGIEKPDESGELPAAPKQETVWDRLIALFGGKEE